MSIQETLLLFFLIHSLLFPMARYCFSSYPNLMCLQLRISVAHLILLLLLASIYIYLSTQLLRLL